MKRICILIRVYDRIEDLQNNLSIIRNTWLSHNYDIIVVGNGKADGYILPESINSLANNVIELEYNAGHLKGNSQLLLEGLANITLSNYDYVIILESDTWLYTDAIINKYVFLLDESDAVWASARWYDRFYSLATDFALIKSTFLKDNVNIFNFTIYPECYVCNYLMDRGLKYILINENMNVMVPSYIKTYPYAPKGRFYVFPKSKMVTHHIEDIKGGMNEKKYYFNVVAGRDFFKVNKTVSSIEKFKISIAFIFDKFLLRRSWYSKRRRCI